MAVPQAEPAEGAAELQCRHHVLARGAEQPLPGLLDAGAAKGAVEHDKVPLKSRCVLRSMVLLWLPC